MKRSNSWLRCTVVERWCLVGELSLSHTRLAATVYGWRHLMKATEVTAGLAESNGSFSPCRWLKKSPAG